MTKPYAILFVCTGNAFRSQMAEAFARLFGGDKVLALSAGIIPAGLHPRAVASMQEIGINISAQTSKILTADLIERADCVVTVCDHAQENCPVIHGRKVLHWSIPDPLKKAGTPQEEEFLYEVRDDIGDRVKALLVELKLISSSTAPKMNLVP